MTVVSSKNKRLFLALLLPEEITSLFSSLTERLPGHPLVLENFHLTLFFFGPKGKEEERKIEEVLFWVVAKEKPLTLSLAGLSFFPSSGRPRGVWAKIAGQDETRLVSFRQKLGEELLAKDIYFDPKPFLPHVTLTRFAKKERVFKKSLPKIPDREFRVSSAGLFESKLSPEGARYSLAAKRQFGL
ncbi:RNA 2',3'-cyclic phosphodiesterase [Candidatus Shapirobacteria bacterium]|nr:RNA 2',3'-cyclic phosphodiesterase [Candidatus Shapirobacteria bacterium]